MHPRKNIIYGVFVACLSRTCSFPGAISKGEVSPAQSEYSTGVTVTYSCQTGYTLQGSRTRNCQSNGQWSGFLPICQIKSCGNPGAPAYGTLHGSSYEFGRSVLFKCNTGYVLIGEVTLTCGANGNWDHAKPKCQIVECPALTTPSNGTANIPRRTYQSIATYSCDTGHVAQGSSSRECLANGQWSGSPLSCEAIKCIAPAAPPQGYTQPFFFRMVPYGTVVWFRCRRGFRLTGGSRSRTCSGNTVTGFWSGSLPSCLPVNCGNPGIVTNGEMEGNNFTLSNKVQFKCRPGYKLSESSHMTCLSSGRWSGRKASCLACPKNSYKLGLSNSSTCSNCPPNTHTITSASTSKQHCACNEGFHGPDGGPCQEILCPNLPPPVNAHATSCSRKINSVCEIECNDGYMVSDGNEFRKCLPGGSWAGSDLACRACPMNTYKANNSSCTLCPDHSSTSGTGNSLQGCRCNAGYHGPAGGPCNDTDECIHEHGCEQTCVNTPGSYRCTCTIPGYVQNANDLKSCLEKNSCPDLEAPENGGVACVQELSTNTARCQVKCNAGYEHIGTAPGFNEMCGQSTNWTWTSTLNEDEFYCAAAWFPDTFIEVEVSYFTDLCNALTEAAKKEIIDNFLFDLRSRNICVANGTNTCDISDGKIHCGDVTDEGYRKRRSIGSGMVIKFVMKTMEASTTKCANLCENHINNDCLRNCENTTIQQAKGSLLLAANQVQDILKQPTSESIHGNALVSRPLNQAPVITIAGVNLTRSQAVHIHPTQTQCPSGMMKRDHVCVECPAGTHLPSNGTQCVQCPRGTHQANPRQTSCLPCVTSPTKTSRIGATSCDQTIELILRPGILSRIAP